MKARKPAILKRAQEVLRIEGEGILNLLRRLDRSFEKAVDILFSTQGKVVVIGMGKSGLIGRKLAATFSSTGTPSLFLHPAEALHGDLGMLSRSDTALMLSYSGETEEIKRLIPSLKSKNIPVVAITGKPRSQLALRADVAILTAVSREACPYNITPTASTTAMLAMGDAIAMVLMQMRGFREKDFAQLHPGGSLGKLLTLKVKDLMRTKAHYPVTFQHKTVREALFVMSRTRLGATSVVDRAGRLVGFFTDGDLRRQLQSDRKALERKLSEVMTRSPVTMCPEDPAQKAAVFFNKNNIDNLPVVDPASRKPVGILDERDLLSEGLV
ncbi:MAG: KpsF/GutQ family sugar-phosphate isomerase [Elusimicrobia bacterium]|nr:KpsF/GutQ family sugar-phosphate isomerase [Elusimicrobiota bacterium]